MREMFVSILLSASVYSAMAQTSDSSSAKGDKKKYADASSTGNETFHFPLAGTWIFCKPLGSFFRMERMRRTRPMVRMQRVS